jgi:hypothetical protein
MIAEKKRLLKEMTIAEAIEQWPQIASLFLQHRLACLGCDMAGFCTFGDIRAHYASVDLPALLAELQDLIEGRPGD